MKKILTIVGTRPQIIKSAAITRVIQTFFPNNLKEFVVDTGQHFDDNMSSDFYAELGIPLPQVNLKNHSLSLTRMVEKLCKAIDAETFDAVLVYGDTNSTLAGSIYAAMNSLPLFHIEAGLRSHNFNMPEEWNRVLTDGCSDLLFAPTELALRHLKSTDTQSGIATYTGDIMFDNCKYYGDKINDELLQELDLVANKYIFFTCHRASNTDDKPTLKAIIDQIVGLAKCYKIVWPMHPRTRSRISEFFGQRFFAELSKSNIVMTQPLSYIKTVVAMRNCLLVVTDSGGIQKESYFLKKKSIVMRAETEWEEIVDDGAAMLYNPICDNIIFKLEELSNQKATFKNHYGDGNAAKLICNQMVTFFDL